MDGELERLGERIAEQAAHLDAAMHRLLGDLREFDARGGWHVQGAMSCAHWLAWRVGWDLEPDACSHADSAESQVAPATRLAVIPLVQQVAGHECNDSAESHVAPSVPGITAISVPGHIENHRVDDSAESSAVLSASATTTMVGHIDSCSIGDSAESRDVDREGSSCRGPSVLRQRADAARRAFSRADALVSLAQGYLRGDRPHRSPIEIMLTTAGSSLRAGVADPLEAGEIGESFIATEAARRLSCDAGVVEVIEDEAGVPLSVGRKRRTIAGALKRALHRRDGACVYPGCINRIFLEGHHIKHWADGGETSLENTALLCSAHHRYVHEHGYAIELGPDQRPCFRNPYGQLVPAVPAPPVMADLGWPRIRAANQPLAIDAGTIGGPWDGTPVDYGRIVGHLVAADGLG
jgi:hypothetical protein